MFAGQISVAVVRRGRRGVRRRLLRLDHVPGEVVATEAVLEAVSAQLAFALGDEGVERHALVGQLLLAVWPRERAELRDLGALLRRRLDRAPDLHAPGGAGDLAALLLRGRVEGVTAVGQDALAGDRLGGDRGSLGGGGGGGGVAVAVRAP